jgi:hypothetical protein
MAALRHYDSWDRLMPRVFGVSQSKFERGWGDWVANNIDRPVRPRVAGS